ncbi:MAG: four helix bundle protein [Bacteroidota bacterium]
MEKTQIVKLTYNYSLRIICLYQELIKNQEYILSKQLLRSATSIGANVFEAGAAISKRDFAHKMSIASKEARETYYWLKLLKDSNLIGIDLTGYIEDVKSIINVLTAIVKTTQRRIRQK